MQLKNPLTYKPLQTHPDDPGSRIKTNISRVAMGEFPPVSLREQGDTEAALC